MSVSPAIRQSVMAQAQGALSLNLAYIGVTNGLFVVLAARGAQTVEQLSAAAERDVGYVQRWADAAYAFGLLDRVDGRIALTELGEAYLPHQPGSLFPLAVQAVLSSHMAERAAGLMATGERPGERVLAERQTVLPWFGPMLEATFGDLFAQHVLPNVPALQQVGRQGGLAVDLGCGNGWYLRRMVSRFPDLRGIGLDMVPENIAAAKAAALREGLSSRLQFHQGDIHHFTVDEPVDLIAMNRALHHVWAEGPQQVLASLWQHLVPGGHLVLWEPRWPDDPTALREQPKLRGMAFQNLAEHVQGNRFLRASEVESALQASGFEAETFLFAEGTEMVIVGRRV